MKITICGSIAFIDEMQKIKGHLEELRHEVKLPPSEVKDKNSKAMPAKQFYKLRKTNEDNHSWLWQRKEELMRHHFNKVVWSDAILVLNHDKNSIAGYIGANTLLEMGLAFHLGKRIYLLNQIPEISYKEEILGMQPEVINGDLTKIA